MTLPSQEDEYQQLQDIYLKWHDRKRPLSGYIHELSALIAKAEANKLEWAWGIIANAGKIWDEDTKEAKEWREVAWKLEKDYYDHIEKLKDGDE